LKYGSRAKNARNNAKPKNHPLLFWKNAFRDKPARGLEKINDAYQGSLINKSVKAKVIT